MKQNAIQKAKRELNKAKAKRIQVSFLSRLNAEGLPEATPEHRFWQGRRFRFDYAWVDKKIALEVEGGLYGNGKNCPRCKRPSAMGHTSVTGIRRDMEKYNEAAALGWRLIRVEPSKLESTETIELLKRLLT
jgi:hypothetical protein